MHRSNTMPGFCLGVLNITGKGYTYDNGGDNNNYNKNDTDNYDTGNAS